MNASKGVEFNVATFEFPEVSGTLAFRGTPKGARYNLEFVFQGDDHLDRTAAFEASAADPHPWTIEHPKYGRILVQPVGYTLDDSAHNLTRVSCPVVETISTTPDAPQPSAPDTILAAKAEVDGALARDFATTVPAPSAATVQDMISGTAAQYQSVLSSIREGVDAEACRDAYTRANSAITAAFSNSYGAITAIQDLVSLPATFGGSVVERLSQLGAMLGYLLGTVPFISDKQKAKLFEASGGAIIGAMVAATVTGTAGSYPNRGAVMGVIAALLGHHGAYMGALYGLQSPNGGQPGSFVPSAGGITALSALVSYGVTTLFAVAERSKQERSFFLEADSNLIPLTHRLYGRADDSAIDSFIATNNIGLSELLLIRKGRKITYYL